MLDAADVRWLLTAVGSVSAIVVLLAVYGSHLERRYTKELEPEAGDDHEGAASDGLPGRYHGQALAQAWVSYYICLFFAGLGFILLVGSDDGRGVVVAVITVAVSALFFIESRKSRATMLEQSLAMRAEQDERRREESRIRLIGMVSEPEARDRLVTELVMRRDTVDADASRPRPGQPAYVEAAD